MVDTILNQVSGIKFHVDMVAFTRDVTGPIATNASDLEARVVVQKHHVVLDFIELFLFLPNFHSFINLAHSAYNVFGSPGMNQINRVFSLQNQQTHKLQCSVGAFLVFPSKELDFSYCFGGLRTSATFKKIYFEVPQRHIGPFENCLESSFHDKQQGILWVFLVFEELPHQKMALLDFLAEFVHN